MVSQSPASIRCQPRASTVTPRAQDEHDAAHGGGARPWTCARWGRPPGSPARPSACAAPAITNLPDNQSSHEADRKAANSTIFMCSPLSPPDGLRPFGILLLRWCPRNVRSLFLEVVRHDPPAHPCGASHG